MNLDARSADTKLFSRFKFYNGLPYTAEDMHGETDNMYRKVNLILDSLVGSGVLETPVFSKQISSTSISIKVSKPFAVNIKGDIFLVGSSDNVYPITVPNTYKGTIILVCWLSNISNNTKNYEYGCMRNTEVSMSDLIDTTLNIQTSTRYQIRYDILPTTALLDYNSPVCTNLPVSNMITDAGTKTLTISSSIQSILDHIYVGNATSNIPSSDGKFYIIPIATIDSGSVIPVEITKNTISVSTNSEPTSTRDGLLWYNPTSKESKFYFGGEWKNLGGVSVTKKSTQPTSPTEGLIWYNTSTGEFKLYINEVGFVSLNNLLSFMQLLGSYTFTTTHTNEDITISIPIEEFSDGDLLSVYYEGVVLSKGTHYILNTANKTITLLNFSTNIGDTLQFNDIRIINGNIDNSSLSLLNNHLNLKATENVQGHCKLSDTTDGSGLTVTTGYAATPKAVFDVKNMINVYTDETTNKKYKIKIYNGNITLEEII